MNAIFFLTWTATVWVSSPCASAAVDPYTGVISTAPIQMNCGSNQAFAMTKEFDSAQTAEDFKKNCPVGVCSDFKLEKLSQ